jgi:predicted homoserine dehydrogenase-like protein
MGLAEGCTLTRDISRDTVLTHRDIEMPLGRVVDRLRHEQDEQFRLDER